MILKNKSVLLFAPAFFQYEQKIKNKLEELGAVVRLYNERCVDSAFERALLKFFPRVFWQKSQRYYDSIIEDNIDMYFDYILIVKCDMITVKTLNKIRNAFPNAKICLHLWDSIKNIPGIREKIKYFDHASSFDRNDCSKEKKLSFRPLFYSDDFEKKTQLTDEYQYDMAFCGTIHSDRYDILKEIEKQCAEKGWKYYSFYYLQSKFVFYLYKILKKSFRNSKEGLFSYEKKSHAEIARIENQARIIVDIQHPGQSGLTMRTIEMLGMRKKLITTNSSIIHYDFYNSANICVIDRKNPHIDGAFLYTPYKDVPEDIYEKYSLKQWVLDVLGIAGEEL